MSDASPLDELHISADKVWEKIAPGYVLTDEEIRAIVLTERDRREKFMKKSAEKKIKREDKAEVDA